MSTPDPILAMVEDRLHEVGVDMAALGFDLRRVQVQEGPDHEPDKRRYTFQLEFKRVVQQ